MFCIVFSSFFVQMREKAESREKERAKKEEREVILFVCLLVFVCVVSTIHENVELSHNSMKH